jgi:hypothetical protein
MNSWRTSLEEVTAKANFGDEIVLHEIFDLGIKAEMICEDCSDVDVSKGARAANLGTRILLDIQDPRRKLSMMEYMRQSEFMKTVELKCESPECLLVKRPLKQRTVQRYTTKSPEILVMRFKRDAWKPTGEQIKITGKVQFEEYINPGEFTESGAPQFYQFQGVISHDGINLHFGH